MKALTPQRRSTAALAVAACAVLVCGCTTLRSPFDPTGERIFAQPSLVPPPATGSFTRWRVSSQPGDRSARRDDSSFGRPDASRRDQQPQHPRHPRPVVPGPMARVARCRSRFTPERWLHRRWHALLVCQHPAATPAGGRNWCSFPRNR